MALSPAARAALARSQALNRRYGLGRRRTPGRAPVAAVPRVAPPRPVVAPAAARPKTLAEQAAEIAALSIDPARKEIADAVAAAEAQRVARTKAFAGVTDALGQMSAGDAAQAQAAFQGAADHTSQYAQGLTGSLHDTQAHASDQAASLIAQLGAHGAIANGADANQNVSYMTGGLIPASGLAAEAPQALLNAQAHRLSAGARLADDASMADFKAGTEIEGIRGKLAELEAKRPGIILEALQGLTQQENSRRATQTQIGYLQLQQAKTVQDQAIAMTNMTGTVHVVKGTGKNAHVVDTGRPAGGSDAAQVAAGVTKTKLTAAASQANARLAAQTRREVATTSAQSRRYAADSSAAARIEAQRIANEGRLAAARISAAKKTGKQASAKDKAAVLDGASATGNTLVKSRVARIKSLMGAPPVQGKDESVGDYKKRESQYLRTFQQRMKKYRPQIKAGVVSAITAQLRLIGYTQAQIAAQAEAIVRVYIPAG